MFEAEDIRKYREIKAPDSLKERVMADCVGGGSRKAHVFDMAVWNRKSVRTWSAVAACLVLLIGIFSVNYFSGSAVTLSYGGTVIGAERYAVNEAVPFSADARSTDPAGIPFEIDVRRGGEATVSVTDGTLYCKANGEMSDSHGTDLTVTRDCVLYWEVDGTEKLCELTVSVDGKKTVYVLEFSIDAPSGVIYKK